MLPPQPQFSLPTPQKRTFHGSARPFARRSSAIESSPSEVRYSTHCCISRTLPEPTLPQMYGSHPSWSHRSMNSWVPKWLVSMTPPQWVLMFLGRCSRGPMPSIQWYSSAKQPPGQRRLGMRMARSASTRSLRIPRVLGIGESSPTQKPS